MKKTLKKIMKKTLKNILIYVALSIIVLIGFIFIFFLPFLLEDVSYSDKTNFFCPSAEVFTEEYAYEYNLILEELLQDCNIDFQKELSTEITETGNGVIRINLLSQQHEISIFFLNTFDSVAHIKVEYVFSGNSTDLTDYSKQAQIVNLTNDFVNKVAYDAILEANEFEKLFGIALDDKDRYATTDLHFDSAIGNVDYYVAIKDNFVRYEFEGLCKKTDFMEQF
ncbi:MAG: hypothetical protein IJV77_03615 [Clostridia bacterium]|nr:hypothetical protein [Clostridia bacterium]